MSKAQVTPQIQIGAGRYFDLERPHGSPICIHDIARSLSKLCRFTGHLDDHYSVAQHSVIVSRIVPPALAFAALLHDAAEAYTGDISKPFKTLLGWPLKAIEQKIEAAVFRHFGLPVQLPPEVKEADLIALATEARDLLPHPGHGGQWDYIKDVKPLREKITPIDHRAAYYQFLGRYYELGGKHD